LDQGQETSYAEDKSKIRPRTGTHSRPRPHSRSQSVMDEGQANDTAKLNAIGALTSLTSLAPEGTTIIGSTLIPTTNTTSTRPIAGGIAYPFKLKIPDDDVKSTNASMMTLDSADAMDTRPRTGGASSPLGPLNVGGFGGSGGTPAAEEGTRPTVERFETAREDL